MKTEKIMVQELEFGLSRPDGKSVQLQKNKNGLRLIEGSSTRKKARTFIVILLVFAAFFTIITRYSQMTKLNYEIADLKESLITQNAINSTLGVELEKKTNVMKIRHTAETELGMQEPDKHQIVYVNVPRANSTFAAAEPTHTGDDAIGIFNFIKGFIFGAE